MLRFFAMLAVAGTLATSAPAKELDVNDMLAVQGIGSVLAAAKQCGFEIDEAALNKYMESRGILTPEALAIINVQVSYGQEEEFTPAQCAIHRGFAASIGAAGN